MEKVIPGATNVANPVLRSFQSPTVKSNRKIILAAVAVVIAGITSGWFLSGSARGGVTAPIVPGTQQVQTGGGIADESKLKDTAEGTLMEGGIDGEGTHYLDTGKGPSKYVYLTSSVIDLQSFVGKKVQVWGETIAAKKAGWLMDVGKIKTL